MTQSFCGIAKFWIQNQNVWTSFRWCRKRLEVVVPTLQSSINHWSQQGASRCPPLSPKVAWCIQRPCLSDGLVCFNFIPRTWKKSFALSIWMFPKIGGKPAKWMVYNGSKPYSHYFWFNTHILYASQGDFHLFPDINSQRYSNEVRKWNSPACWTISHVHI